MWVSGEESVAARGRRTTELAAPRGRSIARILGSRPTIGRPRPRSPSAVRRDLSGVPRVGVPWFLALWRRCGCSVVEKVVLHRGIGFLVQGVGASNGQVYALSCYSACRLGVQ